MIHKDFKIQKKVFKRRKLSTLQHKLRVIMKCYTVINFDLDDEEQTFTFQKTHKVNGVKFTDKSEYSGRFEVEDIEDNNVNLRLIIGEVNKEDDAD